MKKFFVLLFAIITSVGAFGQVAEADSCVEAFNLPKAISLYEEYLTNNDDDEAARRLADCYRKVGRYNDAIARLQSIDSIAYTHGDMRAMFFSCKSLAKAEDIEVWGNRIMLRYPYDSEIAAALAAYYNDTLRPLLAAAVARQYVATDSTNVLVNRQLAYACYLNKHYDEAQRLYRQLLKDGFDNYESCFILGDCYDRADSLNLAIQYFEKALEWKDGKDCNALYRLGKVYLTIGDARTAADYLKQAEELLQPDPEMIYSINKILAAAYFSTKQYIAAADCFDKCISKKPDDILAYYNAAQMYCAAKEMTEAKSYLKQFLALSDRLEDNAENKGIIATAKRQMEEW